MRCGCFPVLIAFANALHVLQPLKVRFRASMLSIWMGLYPFCFLLLYIFSFLSSLLQINIVFSICCTIRVGWSFRSFFILQLLQSEIKNDSKYFFRISDPVWMVGACFPVDICNLLMAEPAECRHASETVTVWQVDSERNLVETQVLFATLLACLVKNRQCRSLLVQTSAGFKLSFNSLRTVI